RRLCATVQKECGIGLYECGLMKCKGNRRTNRGLATRTTCCGVDRGRTARARKKANYRRVCGVVNSHERVTNTWASPTGPKVKLSNGRTVTNLASNNIFN